MPLQRLGLLAHNGHPFFAAAILDRLIQTADILQNTRSELCGLLPHLLSHISAERRNDERHHNAHTQIGGERQDAEPDMERTDVNAHHSLHD